MRRQYIGKKKPHRPFETLTPTAIKQFVHKRSFIICRSFTILEHSADVSAVFLLPFPLGIQFGLMFDDVQTERVMEEALMGIHMLAEEFVTAVGAAVASRRDI
jgi:hypothetical protein